MDENNSYLIFNTMKKKETVSASPMLLFYNLKNFVKILFSILINSFYVLLVPKVVHYHFIVVRIETNYFWYTYNVKLIMQL